MAATFQYRLSGEPEAAGNRRGRPGAFVLRSLSPARFVLFFGLVLLIGCAEQERSEIEGTYMTRDGLTRLSFLPGRRYRIQYPSLDLSLSGAYHRADARKIVLESPLRRFDETLGPPLLIRHRDELRLYTSEGQVVRFFRQRDERDGPEPLIGELDPQDEEEETPESEEVEDEG